MKISVIVPAYNCAAVLENTIRSILSSGLEDYELVIIDDGSKDGAAEICDRLAEEHDPIRCIHQENAGVSAARNRGIAEAQGEYILFFDADDSVDKGSFAHAYEVLCREEPDMLIFGASFDYYHRGRRYRRDEIYYPEEICLNAAQWSEKIFELYACNALSPVWNKFIKRSVLTENGVRFDGKVFEMEDFLFSVKCLQYCDKLYMLPEAIYRYRQAEDERSTYNRLCRVDSLTEYMKPFENTVEELREALAERGIPFSDGEALLNEVFFMLFHELIRYADTERIKAAALDLLGGKYAAAAEKQLPVLYSELKNGQYEKVHMRHIKSRLRHFAAVRYKYLRSL